MFGFVASKFHYTLNEFDDLTYLELYHLLKSYNEDQKNQMILDYNRMRLQTFYQYNIQLPISKRINDPKDFMKFYWDDEFKKEDENIIIPSPEKWDELDRKSEEIEKNQNKKIFNI